MTPSSVRSRPRPIALALAGTGLAGALALTGGGADFLAQVAAKTLIVVGGASDPTAKDQWKRISGDYTGPAPVFVQYPAVFGIGFPGFALSSDGEHTYAQSNDIGATATVEAITAAKQNPDEEVVVYTISQGADVVGLAVLRYGRDHPRPSDGSAKLTFIEQGSPSFVRSGAWNVIPAGIPGLHNGPIRNDGASGAKVISICVKGDIGCAMGLNPVSAMVYLVPGFLMHGTVYTAEDIGRYSPLTGEPFTPGSSPETPVATRTEIRNGNTVTVETYADGTIKRTWVEDQTTWVSIDRENPWGWMLRRNGFDVPIQFDQFLNGLIPVPEPGESGLVPRPPVSAPVATPTAEESSGGARHRDDRPGAVPVAELLSSTDSPTSVEAAPIPSPTADRGSTPAPPAETPPTAPTSPQADSESTGTTTPVAEVPATVDPAPEGHADESTEGSAADEDGAPAGGSPTQDTPTAA
ncbi:MULTISPECIES: PE-PPE domain-containing protein [Tsukamurella]|uniref:PE-PPE domain-containing protein n=2 Tax=Tsukamurella TaxID=2060 RepID=A0A5C5RYZ4_9ACTN|nr:MULTISPECIES: PE-PPE domain-containing protein [Tsukamurella]NMD54150.1 PE-PPE domain-containing protein [Tsukamurella columbiensis]TWS28319.1 PE-PPE domain-containing protein [Tsukamurella conjunctivitidis]